MNYPFAFVALSISMLLLLNFILNRTTKSKSTGKQAPEPDGAWPIIGHLHLLCGGNQILHRTLGSMADKHGPAFNIRLGNRRALVVSSSEVAKECFTVNDKAFATRPKTSVSKHMCYNHATFSLAPYSPFWREMRKITFLEILSDQRVKMMKDIHLSEISFGINDLYTRWAENGNSQQPVVVDLTKWCEHVMLNIIVRMVAGKRYFGGGGDGSEEGARCQKAITDFFWLSGVFVLEDAIPWLSWVDIGGYKKCMKNTGQDFDLILGGWLDEHRQKRKLESKRKEEDVKDFIDVILSLEDEGKLSNFEHDSDTAIKSTCMALILGANDTTAVTLTWAISLLLNHQDILKKLQHELDEHVGNEREVDESDIENLVFLEAVIKETLRLYPPAPLLGPREAMEDCTVSGYNVKAGTRLIVNVSKLQRDERVWSDPSKFQPERFMGSDHKHVDLRGQQFVLVPFGYGRRSCPGATFALQAIHLTLARLVHSFNLHEHRGLPVDMNEGPGLTVPKKTPLEVLVTPRLPSKLYDYYAR